MRTFRIIFKDSSVVFVKAPSKSEIILPAGNKWGFVGCVEEVLQKPL